MLQSPGKKRQGAAKKMERMCLFTEPTHGIIAQGEGGEKKL
jgi:hypothetical protein